jgi:hypothetical protein
MLRNSGADVLADDVAGQMDDVRAAVSKVRELMTRARRPAEPAV